MTGFRAPADVDLTDSSRPTLLSAAIISLCLDILTVIMRLIARRVKHVPYGLEDWFILAAVVRYVYSILRPHLELTRKCASP